MWAGSGVVRKDTHTQKSTQERTRKCCTYLLATYPFKKWLKQATKTQPMRTSITHLLLCILFSFFALSTPPFPRQLSSPKSPLSGTSNLLFLVEKRQPARAGFWGRFWTGSPHRKKGKSFFLARARKGGIRTKWFEHVQAALSQDCFFG